MRTIAQFGIRDADGADSQITEVAEPRSGVGSVVGVASSLRNVETVTTPQPQPTHDYARGATGGQVPYESSILESPPLPISKDDDRDDTPTGAPNNYLQGAGDCRYRSNSNNAPQLVTDYFPPQEPPELYSASVYDTPDGNRAGNGYNFSPLDRPDAGPGFDFNSSSAPPPPRFDSKPTLHGESGYGQDPGGSDVYSLPSQSRQQSRNVSASNGRGGGGLRVANADDYSDDGDNAWPQEAIMHMNLARGESRKGDRYDGSGYGAAT